MFNNYLYIIYFIFNLILISGVIGSFFENYEEKAKEILGDSVCVGGNMPISLLNLGTPQEVKDYAKKLIDTVGKDGGYLMMNGAVIDEAKPENVKTIIDFTKEYGIYN